MRHGPRQIRVTSSGSRSAARPSGKSAAAGLEHRVGVGSVSVIVTLVVVTAISG